MLYNYVYSFAKDIITKYSRLCGINNRNLLHHNSKEASNPIPRCRELSISEASLLSLRMPTFLLCPLCVHIPGVCVSKFPLL